MGLEELRRSEPIFAIGRTFALGFDGLVALAACLGGFELAVMAILIAYLIERLDADVAMRASQTLEAALILIVAASAIAILSTLINGDAVALARHGVHLALAGIAARLIGAERRAAPGTEPGSGAADGKPARAVRWGDPVLDGWFRA